MGYDVRYTQTRTFIDQEWGEMARAVVKLAAAGKSRIGDLVHPAEGRRSANTVRRSGLVTHSWRIAFNGKRPAGGEDFELFRKCSEYPHHARIKTNRHPYDLLVKATLLAAHRIAPDAVPQIGADGGPEDWLDAIGLADHSLGARHGLPTPAVGELPAPDVDAEEFSWMLHVPELQALTLELYESPLRIDHPEFEQVRKLLSQAGRAAAAEPDAGDVFQEATFKIPSDAIPALARLISECLEAGKLEPYGGSFRHMLNCLEEEAERHQSPSFRI